MTQPHTPTLEALAERVMAVQADVAEMKDFLKESVSQGTADRAQLNVRVARLEEQNKITRYVLGTVATAAITGLVIAVIQVIQTAG